MNPTPRTDIASTIGRLRAYFDGEPAGDVTASDVRRVCDHAEELKKALFVLLDDWERSSAGFPQHIEIRYACRDRARAALEGG